MAFFLVFYQYYDHFKQSYGYLGKSKLFIIISFCDSNHFLIDLHSQPQATVGCRLVTNNRIQNKLSG